MPHARDDERDRRLLAAIAAGQPEAMGELYDRHAASLYRHALALARRQADAEDLVQAVFVKLATTGAELTRVKAPAGYLHRMLHLAWIDAHRREDAGERAIDSLAADARASAADPANALDLARAMKSLPPLQREVIVLHLVEGFSFREVGRLTGVSLFTAAARYRLAIGRMRKTLAPSGGTA